MQASWKMRNALRLTASFEEISWNQVYHYNRGDIVYFTGNSETDKSGNKFMDVCFWEEHRKNPSDIPAQFWVLAKWLERAYDVPDREVCRPDFNFNPNVRHSLCKNGKGTHSASSV